MANILVVDDDYLVRNILEEVLKLQGHKIAEASDGQEALDAINPNALPDLILMDNQMPRLKGIDCARRLKTLYSGLKIVLISGCFGEDAYIAANKYLFTKILPKPFQIKDVVSTVEYCLGGKEKGNLNLPDCGIPA